MREGAPPRARHLPGHGCSRQGAQSTQRGGEWAPGERSGWGGADPCSRSRPSRAAQTHPLWPGPALWEERESWRSQGGAQVGRRPVSQETVLPLRKGCAGPGTAGRMQDAQLRQGLGWGRVSRLGVRMRRSGRQCRGQRGRETQREPQRWTADAEQGQWRSHGAGGASPRGKSRPAAQVLQQVGAPLRSATLPACTGAADRFPAPSPHLLGGLSSLTQATIRYSPHPRNLVTLSFLPRVPSASTPLTCSSAPASSGSRSRTASGPSQAHVALLLGREWTRGRGRMQRRN